jgi:hypothetical protein
MSRARSKSMSAACIALGTIAVSGCADAGADEVSSREVEAEETSEAELATTSQAVSSTAWKNLLCDVVNAVPSVDLGSFKIKDPECSGGSDPRSYYFGSGGPGDYASTIATATFCALADASTRSAKATFSSKVGAFGAKSQVIAHSRNNQTRHIETEHLGKVVAFGVEIPLQFAEATWDFPTEHQPKQKLPAERADGSTYKQSVPKQDGYYMMTDGWTLKHWSVGGKGTIPIGPVDVYLNLDVQSDNKLKHYANGRFSRPPAWADYSDMVADAQECRETCTSSGPISCEFLCGGPSAEQIKGHELLCGDDGCNASYFNDLTDGVLPYSGPFGGTRGDIFFGDPLPNYWQTGFPAWGALTGLDEPKYSVLSPDGKSFDFYLDIKAGYEIGSVATITVGTTLDFETRTGMSLRNELLENRDLGAGSVDRGRVRLDLDAETAINLNAYLDLKIPLLFTTVEFHADYDIIDKSGNGHVEGHERVSKIEWSAEHEGANNAPTAECTAFETPEPARVHPPVSGVAGFMYDLAAASVDNMHPCKVEICVPSSPNSTTGKITKYKWVDSTRKLVVDTRTSTSCNVCDSKASLCNVDEVEIAPMAPPTSCEAEPACGGGQVCDSIDDCGETGGGGCIAGCCVVIR